MAYRCSAAVFLLWITSVGTLSGTRPAWAETLTGSNVETRLVLALRVNQAALQGWLPAPWQVNPIAAAPSKDANLVVTFVDRLLGQDAEGKLHGSGICRVVALTVPAKHPQTGESAPFVIRIYESDLHEIPGDFKNSVQATVRREQRQKGTNVEIGEGRDVWEMRDTAGGTIDLQIEYRRALPSRTKTEVKPRSAVE